MAFHYLPIIALIFAALLVVGFKLLKPGTKLLKPDTKSTHCWAVKARSPVSLAEQQLHHRLIDAFPHCIVLSQVAVSQLVSVLPGPSSQVAFNKISRLVADFVLCAADFEVMHIIELDDSSHAAPHRKNADRNKSEALAAAGYSLVRFQASKPPTVTELQDALPVLASNVVPIPARKQSASLSGKTTAARRP
jgi:hypothetical protein